MWTGGGREGQRRVSGTGPANSAHTFFFWCKSVAAMGNQHSQPQVSSPTDQVGCNIRGLGGGGGGGWMWRWKEEDGKRRDSVSPLSRLIRRRRGSCNY